MQKSLIIKTALKYFIIIFSIAIAFVFTSIRLSEKEKLNIIKTEELFNLMILKNKIEADIYGAGTDLLALSSQNFALQLILEGDSATYNIINNGYVSISKYKEYYDQLRFIDISGQEQLRIEYNNGNPINIPREKLQNKKDRYYFKNSINIRNNTVYMSPLDLNVENGIIEKPFKPMIRFSTPIWANGTKLGILILNYKAKNMLSSIDKREVHTFGDLYLTNQHSELLFSPNEDQNWGNMFSDRKKYRFNNLFTPAWDKIIKKDNDQFELNNTIYTYYKINANSLNSDNIQYIMEDDAFFLISRIDLNKTDASPNMIKYMIYASIIFLISLIITAILLYFQIGKLKVQQKLIKREQELSESNTTKDTLFSIISHDLRGPIGNISGTLSLLNSGILNPSDAERFLKKLGESIKATQSLLENLLTWASNQKNGIVVRKKYFSFLELYQEVFIILEPLSLKKNIEIKSNFNDDLIIEADRDMLLLILRNIISNSIKFTDTNGEVLVSAEIKENHICINISDNGMGMSNEIRSKIFSKTEFVSTKGTDNEHGSGLGLKLCYEFVQAHNGDIVVESEVGKGTKFKIVLPM